MSEKSADMSVHLENTYVENTMQSADNPNVPDHPPNVTFGVAEDETEESETSSQTNSADMICDLNTGNCVTTSNMKPSQHLSDNAINSAASHFVEAQQMEDRQAGFPSAEQLRGFSKILPTSTQRVLSGESSNSYRFASGVLRRSGEEDSYSYANARTGSFREGAIQQLSCAISPKSTPAATVDVVQNSSGRKRTKSATHKYVMTNNPSNLIYNTIQSSVGFRATSGSSTSAASLNARGGGQFSESTTVMDLLSGGKKDAREFTYNDIESSIGKSYIDASGSHYSSNALDVLALYIKGQKLLYTEAKTYCEQQLNFLMLPAIFISCVGSIFSFLSDRYVEGPLIIASLNGFNAFLLSLISYLKLDAKAQAHKTSAYKFDKLESICEFNSGKFMFFATKPTDILEVVEKIETDVKEIKETNQFILPESIRYEFSFTYSTNIFMLVKKIQSLEMADTHSLKNCMNYVLTLREQLELAKQPVNIPATDSTPESIIDGKIANKDLIKRLIAAINDEENRKNQFVNNILECRKQYYELDAEFNREIHRHIRRANKWILTRVLFCDWLKS